MVQVHNQKSEMSYSQKRKEEKKEGDGLVLKEHVFICLFCKIIFIFLKIIFFKVLHSLLG